MERESPLIYSFAIRQYLREYLGGKGKSTFIYIYIYSFSIRQFIWEYMWKGKVHGYIRFQMGNSFGNICGKGKSTYIFVFNWAILSGIYKWKKLAYILVFN